jgi:hypothetical protein
MMNKYAAEQIKLAHLSGTAAALSQLGFPPQTAYSVLMEKGASAAEAEMLTKEAFGWLSKGLGWIGKKLPALAKWLRGGARASKSPGFAQRALGNAGTAFSGASKGMKTDPGGTLWQGLQHYGRGLIGGGEGVGGGLGRATTVGLAARGLFGGDEEPPPATMNTVMQPPYGGQ